MGERNEAEPRRSQVNDAIFSTLRGGFRILGGVVQMAAGITRLVAATAIKAATVVEGAVVTDGGDDAQDPKPSDPMHPAAPDRSRRRRPNP
jgi:hypothetical protein